MLATSKCFGVLSFYRKPQLKSIPYSKCVQKQVSLVALAPFYRMCAANAAQTPRIEIVSLALAVWWTVRILHIQLQMRNRLDS